MKVDAEVLPLYVRTVMGSPYLPAQIHKKVCDAFKWNHKPSPLTSLVNIGDANSIQVTLRTSTTSGEYSSCRCRFSEQAFLFPGLGSAIYGDNQMSHFSCVCHRATKLVMKKEIFSWSESFFCLEELLP